MHGFNVVWTKDYEALKVLLALPEIADWAFEDSSQIAFVDNDEIVRWAGVYKGCKLVGAFVFLRRLNKMWEVHTCLSHEARGALAVPLAKAAVRLLFSYTTCACLTTLVPAGYKHVVRFTKQVGLAESGSFKKAFTRHGEQMDVLLFSITDVEALCL